MGRIRHFADNDAIRTVYRTAHGKIVGSRRHRDDTRMVESYQPTGAGGELNVWEDRSQAFEEIPDNLAFVAQGTTEAMAPWIDERIEEDIVLNGSLRYPTEKDIGLPGFTRKRRSINAADFRERCVVYGKRLYVLYEKRKPDLEPRWYLKCEELASKLDIEIDLAMRLVELIKDLGMAKSMVHRMIYGYTMQNGETRGGLVSIRGDSEAIHETIGLIEQARLGAEEPEEPKEQEMEWLPLSADDYFDERMIYLVDENDESNPDGWDDEMDQLGDANPFGAFPLSDGTDGVNYEFLDYIKSADVATIKQIQKLFFKSENPYSGRVKRAELGHLTRTQKSICWGYINDRKAKLARQGLKRLTRKGRAVLRMVRQMGKGAQSRGLIMAWANAGWFDLGGIEVTFQRTPSEEEVFGMWAEYRKL